MVSVYCNLYFDPADTANDELEPRCVLEPGLSYEILYPISLFVLTLGLLAWSAFALLT